MGKGIVEHMWSYIEKSIDEVIYDITQVVKRFQKLCSLVSNSLVSKMESPGNFKYVKTLQKDFLEGILVCLNKNQNSCLFFPPS